MADTAAAPKASHDPALIDRAIGVVIGAAAGDALGAPYEFKPPLPDDTPVLFTASHQWNLGEWTDDTAMAIPILEQIVQDQDLTDECVQGRIVRRWLQWSVGAKDIGVQTSRVFAHVHPALGPSTTDAQVARLCRGAARAVHEMTRKSAGNGSLMRTGPIALAYLKDDTDIATLAKAARSISEMTHYDPDAGDACVLWSVLIRHAVRTGKLEPEVGLAALPEDRAMKWRDLLAEAEDVRPRDIPRNGWVVAALQAAWSAIKHGDGLTDTLERAVRAGFDTDTVAAIAGSLAGALYGAGQVPQLWKKELHGWPYPECSKTLSRQVERVVTRELGPLVAA